MYITSFRPTQNQGERPPGPRQIYSRPIFSLIEMNFDNIALMVQSPLITYKYHIPYKTISGGKGVPLQSIQSSTITMLSIFLHAWLCKVLKLSRYILKIFLLTTRAHFSGPQFKNIPLGGPRTPAIGTRACVARLSAFVNMPPVSLPVFSCVYK